VFTGIIEELGTVAALERRAESAQLTVGCPVIAASLEPGGSVAVNGVCLTVTRAAGGRFTADVMGETLARSGLGALAPGDPVNLERPVPAAARLDGHIVQGHVDGTGRVAGRRAADGWQVLRIGVGPGLSRYLAEKGSVAVDGVSLTVSAVSEAGGAGPRPGGENWFEVSLIPQTLARTTLGARNPGSVVNIEVDVLAKYTERLLAWHGRLPAAAGLSAARPAAGDPR